MARIYIGTRFEYGQSEDDPVSNTAPDANFSLDSTVDINTNKDCYAASSSDPELDPLTDSEAEIVSAPPGFTGSLVPIYTVGGVDLGWRYSSNVVGDVVRRVRVKDDGGAGRGHPSPVPLWSEWVERTDTWVDPNAGSAYTLNLNSATQLLVPYGGEYGHASSPGGLDPNVCKRIDDNGTTKMEVHIFGDEGSRNGGAYVFDSDLIGPNATDTYTECYIAYTVEFDDNFRFIGPRFPGHVNANSGGGGKIAVAIAGNGASDQSGGGAFYESSFNMRLIFEAHNETSNLGRIKTYFYMPWWGGWFEAEAADYIDNIANCYSSSSYGAPNYIHRFNHWQCGGDRGPNTSGDESGGYVGGRPRHPGATFTSPNRRTAKGASTATWQDWGSSHSVGSRYVGKSLPLTYNGSNWTFSYANGSDPIEIQQYFKMNTFSGSTFNGGIWMKSLAGASNVTWNKPNKDGEWRIWARQGSDAPKLLYNADVKMVYRYPKYPNLGISRLDVGGAAGGNYDNMDGIFRVYNVRISDEPIIT